MLTEIIQQSIAKSVLCWLATVSEDGMPNVSPKEIFSHYEGSIIIADVASPQTVRNIRTNNKVCISFIDILIQKGYQLKGTASLLDQSSPAYGNMEKVLLKITQGLFPFTTIIRINVEFAKPIIAPRYMLFPGTTEEEQYESALKTYGLNRHL
ncbi:pyridoxamine 5'-phosphate oxidase family protein [Dyadobacter flavalbus]|uniref:Pyridoxamine 5'-phosphate oxidase family protein n=2 Tax=Dyadobacter flavalbus TaxID=2579942 RepID=A0A5M8QTD3_9BACT|nr:pyridoxamine 5'-phosphate oxidase family protein [Dyadobacter flavalbus]